LGRVLSMHTGIQTGLVIARRSDSRSGDFTLTGDTVNTAARLRGLALPGEVVVSPQTWQQVEDFFDAEARTPVEVKGKERPLVPYRIVQERVVHARGSRPLVGRSEEVQQFMGLAEICLNRRRGRVIFVRGDPGLGKSRLVAEFVHLAREQGMICHTSAILDFGARTGRDAIRGLAQSLLGLPGDADEASRAEALAQLGPQGNGGAVGHVTFLYELLDVTPPASVASVLSAIDVSARQKATLEAICHLARPAPDAPPMLLMIEDIHWADAWTLQQVAALAALTLRQPVLVMLTTRFAGDPSVGEWRVALHGLPVTSIDLGPLTDDDAMRLAAGAASMSDDALRSCIERAEGNPLFLEQLLLNAGDEGASSLPGSIQALIQSRMDRLEPNDKNALQAAAVWGQRAPLLAIRHLIGNPAYDARVLVQQFLLRPDGEEMVFSHALFRDGAYGSLLHARRRQLHLAAALWVEPRDVALAAEHFERAEDARAVTAYLRASGVMTAQFRYAQALDLVDRGLKVGGDGEHGFALKLARAGLLLEMGRSADAIAQANAAVEAARSPVERAQGLITMASGLRIVDRPQQGLDLLDEAQPLAEQAGMTVELARLHELRGNLLFALGRTLECRHAHERALELARAAGSVEAEAAALGGIGDACFSQGLICTAQAMVARCLVLARQHGLLRVEVAYLQMQGWVALYMLDVRGSIEASRATLALAKKISHRRGELMARAQLALVDGWVRGNWRAAVGQLEIGMDIARAIGSQRFESMGWFMRALLMLRAQDRERARQDIDTAFAVAGAQGMFFIGPQLYAVRARIETDAATQRLALQQGEALLLDAALSLNHFVFHDAAIDVSLQLQDWDAVERYCTMLQTYTAREPLDWAVFIVARGRALCRVGRGESDEALVAGLQALWRQAIDADTDIHATDLAHALRRLGATPT
ncbi:MAG: AAA family ATPase, partial [Variovorax sp.]